MLIQPFKAAGVKELFGAGVESCALVCVLPPCDVASSKLESDGKLRAGFPMTGWKVPMKGKVHQER